jgi:arylsulfatase A-like enzyme
LEAVRYKIQRWLDNQNRYPKLGNSSEYSFYIENCYPTHEDRRKYFESKTRNAKPHIGYKLLCLLAETGLTHTMFTANFDGLAARAAGNFEITPIEIGIDSQTRLQREHRRCKISGMLNAPIPKETNNFRSWHAQFNLTILSAYFFASMEWLFFATKPSSLSLLSSFDKVKILFVTAGTVALIFILFLILLSLPALLISNSSWRSRLLNIGTIAPAVLLSITALIMLDNFTYTVFKFGIVSTKGYLRGIYALGFLFFFWRMLRFVKQADWARQKFASYLALSLLTISMIGILTTRLPSNPYLNRLNTQSLNLSSVGNPNIIILGSDGLSASYLTAYGSSLNSTPFLTKLAQTSLVIENAFPNAGGTTASTTSVLTGKEPIIDRVYHYPDILSGKDSFEHLPGILRQRGYKTAEIGTPHYVDARRLNLLEGFDIVNNQSLNSPALDTLRALLGNSPSSYFMQTISERASERLLHIFFIRQMRNPLAEVEDPATRVTDEQRVDQIIDLLDHADRPVFIFAHLMDTHGPDFSFQKQVFSSGSSADKPWDESRYLDAILSFDGHVKKIYEHLTETGQLDHTILVIYTDHGFEYATHERIPIIIHFPKNANAGTRQHNIQIIDIPATLLDYLGLPIPAWMDGTSFLQGETPADREIISITAGSPKEIAPPFYQINIVQMIVCQKWYALNVRKNTFESGTIAGHTSTCNEDLLPSDEQVRQRILEVLETYGYIVSSLQ